MGGSKSLISHSVNIWLLLSGVKNSGSLMTSYSVFESLTELTRIVRYDRIPHKQNEFRYCHNLQGGKLTQKTLFIKVLKPFGSNGGTLQGGS